jgi:hypothetical protein
MIVELKRKSPFGVEIDCDMVRLYLPVFNQGMLQELRISRAGHGR